MSIMKSFILALIVAVALIVPARAINCRENPNGCGPGNCCVENVASDKCRTLGQEGELCNPMVVKSPGIVYRRRCPCGDDLTCEAESGKVHAGKCVAEK